MSTADNQPEAEFPQAYGRYELLERIGEGGMAEVFRARLPGVAGFEKILVIKRILPHLSRNNRFVQMFVNEAQLAAKIQHQNVVQVYELGQLENGELYIAMEYVPGVDLRGILRNAAQRVLRIPPWFSVHTVTEILGGLAHAHELMDTNGQPLAVVHRDVTPSNVFVSKNGEIKLADFGIAKAAGQVSQTRSGQLKGKISYMPPEQLHGQPLDARADVFAVGVVLWECLTQRRLFGGRPDFETMLAICEGKRDPPSRYNNKIPPELDALTLEALDPDRDQRVRNAAVFQARLLEVLSKLRSRLLPTEIRHVVEVITGAKEPHPKLGADLPYEPSSVSDYGSTGSAPSYSGGDATAPPLHDPAPSPDGPASSSTNIATPGEHAHEPTPSGEIDMPPAPPPQITWARGPQVAPEPTRATEVKAPPPRARSGNWQPAPGTAVGGPPQAPGTAVGGPPQAPMPPHQQPPSMFPPPQFPRPPYGAGQPGYMPPASLPPPAPPSFAPPPSASFPVPPTSAMPSMRVGAYPQRTMPPGYSPVEAPPPAPPFHTIEAPPAAEPAAAAPPAPPAPTEETPPASVAPEPEKKQRRGGSMSFDFNEDGEMEMVSGTNSMWDPGLMAGSYTGPNPLYLRDPQDRIAGPFGFEELLKYCDPKEGNVVKDVSSDKETWMDVATFASLSGLDFMAPDTSALRNVVMLGKLDQRSLVQVLSRLARTQRTGRLVIMSTGSGKKVSRREIDIVKGAPTFVYADTGKLQLPSLIIKRDIVNEDLMPEIFHAVIKHKKSLEEIISRKAAMNLARHRPLFMRDRLAEVFTWRSGKFAFDANTVPRSRMPFAPSLLTVLVEAVHRSWSRHELTSTLEWKLPRKLEKSERFDEVIAQMELSKSQEQVARRLADGRPLNALLKKYPNDSLILLILAYVLTEMDLLLTPLE